MSYKKKLMELIEHYKSLPSYVMYDAGGLVNDFIDDIQDIIQEEEDERSQAAGSEGSDEPAAS